ncbi:hypothetical protein BGU86_19035 [Clostridioides difficile]|nr:hypothetical protein BGU86_19035 [Clostridioides difficile]
MKGCCFDSFVGLLSWFCFVFIDQAPTETETRKFVGSVRCLKGTDLVEKGKSVNALVLNDVWDKFLKKIKDLALINISEPTETSHDLVCRPLLGKKKKKKKHVRTRNRTDT